MPEINNSELQEVKIKERIGRNKILETAKSKLDKAALEVKADKDIGAGLTPTIDAIISNLNDAIISNLDLDIADKELRAKKQQGLEDRIKRCIEAFNCSITLAEDLNRLKTALDKKYDENGKFKATGQKTSEEIDLDKELCKKISELKILIPSEIHYNLELLIQPNAKLPDPVKGLKLLSESAINSAELLSTNKNNDKYPQLVNNAGLIAREVQLNNSNRPDNLKLAETCFKIATIAFAIAAIALMASGVFAPVGLLCIAGALLISKTSAEVLEDVNAKKGSITKSTNLVHNAAQDTQLAARGSSSLFVRGKQQSDEQDGNVGELKEPPTP